MKRYNLIGNKFKNLQVLSLSGRYPGGSAKWECLCDCGNTCFCRSTSLVSGKAWNCGCLKPRRGKTPSELSGKRFGKLVAIERVGHQGKRILWKCFCDCGREKITVGEYLTSGKLKSCGCLKDIETIKLKNGQQSTKESCAWILYKSYQHNADLRKRTFTLTFDQFKELTSLGCFYCGLSPSQITKGTKNGERYTYNGIDRKDNEIGYEIENCLPCCAGCNYSKNDRNYNEFQSWIKRLQNFK